MRGRGKGLVGALLLGAILLSPSAWSRYINHRLFDPSRRVDDSPGRHGARFDRLEVLTDDGEKLAAWWIPAKRAPIAHVLYFHGAGGNLGDRAHFLALLAGDDLDVLAIDYRGYGASTGSPSEEGTLRDARAARRALLARHGVAPDRVVYVGESLGGGVAVALAAEAPPAALVLQSTFTSIRDLARVHFPHVPSLLIPDLYPSRSRIGSIEVPLLYVHGAEDVFIPPSMGHALFDAAPGPKEIHVLPGVGHADFIPNAGRPLAGLVRSWIAALLSRRASE